MPKIIDKTGEELTSKYGHMTIIRYASSKDIDVKFDNGYIALHRDYGNFKKGAITNPMNPSVLGKGYYGIGKYVAKINGKHTKQYKVWRAMLNRCYGKLFQESHTTYENCVVCDEWLNFQVFAEWFDEHYYQVGNEIMDLDKDFIGTAINKKIYSPETCIFVPQFFNKQIIHQMSKKTELPTGVKNNSGKYSVNVGDKYFGSYNSTKEAFDVYIVEKFNIIKILLESYKSSIPTYVYDAIDNYISHKEYFLGNCLNTNF